MKEGLQNPEFWTSTYDNKENRNPEFIKTKFEEVMLGKKSKRVEKLYSNKLELIFGNRPIKSNCEKSYKLIPILFFNVYLYYNNTFTIDRVEVIRNKLKFPN